MTHEEAKQMRDFIQKIKERQDAIKENYEEMQLDLFRLKRIADRILELHREVVKP